MYCSNTKIHIHLSHSTTFTQIHCTLQQNKKRRTRGCREHSNTMPTMSLPPAAHSLLLPPPATTPFRPRLPPSNQGHHGTVTDHSATSCQTRNAAKSTPAVRNEHPEFGKQHTLSQSDVKRKHQKPGYKQCKQPKLEQTNFPRHDAHGPCSAHTAPRCFRCPYQS